MSERVKLQGNGLRTCRGSDGCLDVSHLSNIHDHTTKQHTRLMKNYCHLSTHVTHRRKPCEKGALHRELIPSATALSIIHGVRIALRAGGVSLLPAVTRTQTVRHTHKHINTHIHKLSPTFLLFVSDNLTKETTKYQCMMI